MNPSPKKVAIVGGGISGLATAYALTKKMPDVELTLVEASNRMGGVLLTEKIGDYLIEHCADNFITNTPWAIDLCKDLQFEDELLMSNPEHRRAFVIANGRLEPIPKGFMVMAPTQISSLLTTRILSWPGKLRLLGEYFVKAKKEVTDESLQSFATRRFGKETYEKLIQPLVGGIYTADPTRLSIHATMPRFPKMEKESGSLVRATLKSRKQYQNEAGVRYSMFVAPRNGMSSLIQKLDEAMPTLKRQTDTAATSATFLEDCKKWALTYRHKGQEKEECYDGLVVATPSYHAAQILAPTSPSLCEKLAKIEYASCAVAVLVYKKTQIEHPLDGFGFVAPLCENREILSGSFASVKFSGRAPDDEVIIRCFIGGACQAELLERTDDQLFEIAQRELTDLLKISGSPRLQKMVRWHKKMPQYHLGHEKLVAKIEQEVSQKPGLELAGNAYYGVGIPNCIDSGQRAAEKMAAYLGGSHLEPVG
ncbi:MAG: protoporphyrinogen oxidase [Pirellulaceae bacterium]|nr:protoporphyrinogen oxidase [Pirellulaceae bacterium]